MKTRYSLLQASLLLACSLSALPAAAEYRQHEAHVHGVARLDVLLDGNTLTIDLDTPAVNLLGFEHVPQNEGEEATLKQVAARLHNPAALFSLPKGAQCNAGAPSVHSPLFGNALEQQHEHADIEASYIFTCRYPVELDGMSINLFRPFAGIHKIEVQQITPSKQGAAELTADSTRLTF